MSKKRSWWFRFASRLACGGLGMGVLLLGAGQSLAQERVLKALSIYSNVPLEGAETRTASELYFEPYFFAPASKAGAISVDQALPAAQLMDGANGTVVEVRVNFVGPSEFAQVGFVPVGAPRLGAVKGWDVAKDMSPAPGQKLYLEFKARRRANDQAVVSFRCGGLAGIPHKDSLRPPATRNPDVDDLGVDWVTYRIDLTAKVAKLDQVLCPLIITIESDRNPKALRERDPDTGKELPFRTVTAYVDDVRFICVEDGANPAGKK